MNNKENENKIIKFIDGELELDVRFSIDDNTVWLSQNDIANLYKIDISSVSRHIKSIIKNDNLPTSNFAENANYRSVVAKFATVQNEGECQVKRTRNYYNQDIILAVGYRTKSNTIYWSNIKPTIHGNI